MAGDMEDLHARERPALHRCPFCHDHLAPHADCWECPRCATRLHAACARDLVACPTLGCGVTIADPRGDRLDPGEHMPYRPPLDLAREAHREPPPIESVRAHALRTLWYSGVLLVLSTMAALLAVACFLSLPVVIHPAVVVVGVLSAFVALGAGSLGVGAGALALSVVATGRESATLLSVFGPRRRQDAIYD